MVLVYRSVLVDHKLGLSLLWKHKLNLVLEIIPVSLSFEKKLKTTTKY